MSEELKALDVLVTYIKDHNGNIPHNPNKLVAYSCEHLDLSTLDYLQARTIVNIYQKNVDKVRSERRKSKQEYYSKPQPQSKQKISDIDYKKQTSKKTAIKQKHMKTQAGIPFVHHRTYYTTNTSQRNIRNRNKNRENATVDDRIKHKRKHIPRLSTESNNRNININDNRRKRYDVNRNRNKDNDNYKYERPKEQTNVTSKTRDDFAQHCGYSNRLRMNRKENANNSIELQTSLYEQTSEDATESDSSVNVTLDNERDPVINQNKQVRIILVQPERLVYGGNRNGNNDLNDIVQMNHNSDLNDIVQKIRKDELKTKVEPDLKQSEINVINSKNNNTIYQYYSVPFKTKDSPTSKDILCDFLIDGYIRSEYNQNLFLFPNSVKQMIALCYNDDIQTLKQKLRQFVEEKTKFQRMTQQRQANFTEKWEFKLSGNKYLLVSIFLGFFVTIVISVIATIIGFLTYYSVYHHCNDHYTTLFTTIAGIACLSHVLLLGFGRLIILCEVRNTIKDVNTIKDSDGLEIKDDEKINHINNVDSFLDLSCTMSTWIMMLFYMIWSILGFIMYHKMSSDCKQSQIGMVLISWCVIIFVAAFIYYCWYTVTHRDNKSINLICSKRRFVATYPFAVISIVLLIVGVFGYAEDEYNDGFIAVIGGFIAFFIFCFWLGNVIC